MKQRDHHVVSIRRGSVAVLAVLSISLTLAACTQEAPPPPAVKSVFALRIENLGEFAERSFPGRARAGQQVNRSFRVAGPLIEFPVSVGDEVEEGQLLARIDPKDYVNRLGTLEGQLDRAQSVLTRAESDLRRIRNVFREDPGATSEVAVDRAQQVRDSAAAGVSSLQASVEEARDQLDYTNLRAPFDGVVVETYVENFETVVPRQPVLRVLDPSSIEFVVQVPENLIGLAPYVESVEVNFDALPGVVVEAAIKEIGREASQATRTYPVTIVMNQPEGAEILPGMAGEATVTSRPPADHALGLVGIDIPMTAVFNPDESGQTFVWVIDAEAGTISRREINLGKLSRLGVLVDSGLSSGEWIVTKGVNTLREGQQVRILEQAGPGDNS